MIKLTDPYSPQADAKPMEPNHHDQIPPGPFRTDNMPTEPNAPRADIVPTQPNVPRCEIAPGDPHFDALPIELNGRHCEKSPGDPNGEVVDPHVVEGFPPGPYRSDISPPGPSIPFARYIKPPNQSFLNEVPPYLANSEGIPPGPYKTEASEQSPRGPFAIEGYPPGPYRLISEGLTPGP